MILKQVRGGEKLKVLDVEPLYDTPAKFAAFIATETTRYAAVVKTSHAHIEGRAPGE